MSEYDNFNSQPRSVCSVVATMIIGMSFLFLASQLLACEMDLMDQQVLTDEAVQLCKEVRECKHMAPTDELAIACESTLTAEQVLTCDQALDDRKVVYVNFKLVGNKFERFSVNQDGMSNRIACKMAKEIGGKYSFLKWVAESPPTSDDPAWTVSLRLVVGNELTLANGKKKKYWKGELVHEVSVDGSTVEFDNSVDIYPVGRPIPFRSPGTIEGVISTQLDEQLPTLFSVPDSPGDKFIKRIPIVQSVIVDRGNKKVVIPINFIDLHSDTKTELRVQLVVLSGETENFTIGAQSVDTPGKYRGFVRGDVRSEGLTEIQNFTPNNWHPDIARVIDSGKEKKVFMYHHSYSDLANNGTTNENGATDVIE